MRVFNKLRRFADHACNRIRVQMEFWGFADRTARVQRDLLGLAETHPQILAAISDTIADRTSQPEREWIERIEELRRQMRASSELLEVMDYGAVSSNVQLSEEEMYAGRMIRKSIGDISRSAGKADRAQLLFRLVRQVKPQTCVELGTSVGLSACYQAAALKLNGHGKLITLEGAESVASVAEGNFSRLGLDNIELVRGRFQDTLPKVLLSNAPVDYAFIDGHHDEMATLKYFNEIKGALAPAAVIVFDDIRWSEGMTRAWDAIRRDRQVQILVDLDNMGIVSTGGTCSPRCFGTRL